VAIISLRDLQVCGEVSRLHGVAISSECHLADMVSEQPKA
jgi:hypothetical protein